MSADKRSMKYQNSISSTEKKNETKNNNIIYNE